MARRSSFRGSGRTFPARAVRNRPFWALGPGGDDLASMDSVGFSASGQSILGAGVTPTAQGLTVMRLHGFLEVQLQIASADLDGFSLAVGVGVVSADAFAVGISAVPKPFDDIDWSGWLYHWFGAIHAPNIIGGAAGESTPTASDNLLVPVESKAMRKLSINDVLFGIVQVGETGTANMTVRLGTRVLLKVTETS